MEDRVSDWTIQRFVARTLGVGVAELRSGGLHHPLVHARHVAMWLVRNVLGLSYPATARSFGWKDHTTIMSACRKVEHDIRTDGPRARLLVEVIGRALEVQ